MVLLLPITASHRLIRRIASNPAAGGRLGKRKIECVYHSSGVFSVEYKIQKHEHDRVGNPWILKAHSPQPYSGKNFPLWRKPAPWRGVNCTPDGGNIHFLSNTKKLHQYLYLISPTFCQHHSGFYHRGWGGFCLL